MAAEITGDEFSVSFNPDSRQGMFGDADGGPETALILENMPCGKDGHVWTGIWFLILKGDFREDYRKLAKAGASKWGLKSLYDEHKRAHGSRWSTDFHEWGRDGKRRRSPKIASSMRPGFIAPASTGDPEGAPIP